MSDTLPVGTIIRHDGEPEKFKKRDGWYTQHPKSKTWVYLGSTYADADALEEAMQEGCTLGQEPEYKTYPFQNFPDIDMPMVFELSGIEHGEFMEALATIRKFAEKAAHSEDIGAARVGAFLDNAVLALETADAEWPNYTDDKGVNGRIWQAVTNVGYRLNNDTNRFEVYPYDSRDEVMAK